MSSVNKRGISFTAVIILLAVISFASVNGMVQPGLQGGKKPVRDITDSANLQVKELAKTFGVNKEIPTGYEKQILYALSYFPELATTHIRFEIVKSKDEIISTRPTTGSIFRRSSKRTYVVTIYDSADGRKLPIFAHGDMNGQVGILGHELCHVIYFSHCTGLGLIGLGVAHVSDKFLSRFEYNTDSADVERGLGYQLICWKRYLRNAFDMRSKTYSQEKIPAIAHRYMTIPQIERAMANSKLYQ